MSLALLFNRSKPTIDAIELDASLSETHKASSEITKNPVELGADVTDHIHNDPDALSITGIISVTPDDITASFNPKFGGSGRAKSAWKQLLELRAKREPFDVFTTLRSYRNLVIADLTTTRTAENSNALEFTIELEEIEIASVSLVANLAADVADLALKEIDFGTQGTGAV